MLRLPLSSTRGISLSMGFTEMAPPAAADPGDSRGGSMAWATEGRSIQHRAGRQEWRGFCSITLWPTWSLEPGASRVGGKRGPGPWVCLGMVWHWLAGFQQQLVRGPWMASPDPGPGVPVSKEVTPQSCGNTQGRLGSPRPRHGATCRLRRWAGPQPQHPPPRRAPSVSTCSVLGSRRSV